MKEFFYPRSVAVVGVSPNPANLGQGIIHNLLQFGFQGKIFPVGPKGGEIQGLKILPGLAALPEPVDLAAILAPAYVVPELLDDCGKLGISRIVVESAGFSEFSESGRSLESEVRSKIEQYNLRLVGPNGLGLINLETGLSLPFAQIPHRPALGNVSLVCQSGGVGTHLISWLAHLGLGMNKFVSLGNKLNVQENEVLAYLLEDEGTKIICLYLEDIADGPGLMEIGRRANKPILLLKANIGDSSAAIARSHTSALAGDDQVTEAACAQAGIFRFTNQREMLAAAALFQQPPVQGNRLAILSRSGGEAVIAADCCERLNFELPPLSPEIKSLIKRRSRAGVIQPLNPLDLGDVFDFPLYQEIMGAFCQDPQIDAVLLNYGPLGESEREAGRQMVKKLIELAASYKKPLAITVLVNIEELEYLRKVLKIPVFSFPEEALQALACNRDWYKRQPPPALPSSMSKNVEIDKILSGLQQQSGPLPLDAALQIIRQAGIPTADWSLVKTADKAEAAAFQLGYPVCLKLVAPSVVHKTDVGGIILDLHTPSAVVEGFLKLHKLTTDRLTTGEPWDIMVMSQISGGVEALAGAKRDVNFGPVIMFGAGGIWVEFLQDTAMAIAPLDEAEAHRLIGRTRLSKILQGGRGQPVADIGEMARILVGLADLMWRNPQIQEVDLNPIRVFSAGQGALALDARIILG